MSLKDTHLPPPWKDVTSYARGDTKRIPVSWEIEQGNLRIVVSRHIHYGPDAWTVTCYPVLDTKGLNSKVLAEAATEALARVKAEIDKLVSDMAAVTDTLVARWPQ